MAEYFPQGKALTISIQHSTRGPIQLKYSKKQNKIRKSIQIRKRGKKLSLFLDNIIIYIENPKTLKKKSY